ncbi:copper chaperone PCu(A)C [Sphingomonas sp. KR1UV-12]|uniref:Copper chaperone PCu(A)C n=1 Tax=Sphingomonas aurea TaxID=3063994 RepID=A0ABT9EFK9_9SPHN|nr:copper chaperone PCu(A)C [Sphingomonas sp. KR1UV-12]MDP1025757.1 copper chaperone PCu(A)C [Sphingomonas sp. KR1UV-12]
MRWLAPMAIMAATLGGCSDPAELAVDGAWVRLPAVASRPGVAYFTVHGGPQPATLINVSSGWAVRADMHESMAGAGGMMAMKPLQDLAIPANGTVAFAPGGRHVMVYGINPAVHAGDTMTFTFTFADGRRIRRVARVLGAGDTGPQ